MNSHLVTVDEDLDEAAKQVKVGQFMHLIHIKATTAYSVVPLLHRLK
jgi:hypothetical protein